MLMALTMLARPIASQVATLEELRGLSEALQDGELDDEGLAVFRREAARHPDDWHVHGMLEHTNYILEEFFSLSFNSRNTLVITVRDHRAPRHHSCCSASLLSVTMRILLACIAVLLPASGGFVATNRMEHRATRLQSSIRHDAWPRCAEGPLHEGESESRTPRVSIEYCTRCNWMRAWGALDPWTGLCLAQPCHCAVRSC